MVRNCGRWIFCAMLGAATLDAPQAQAFQLFGITLFGGDEETGQDTTDILEPQLYTVSFDITAGSEGTREAIRNASGLWGNRDTAASGVSGLVSEARGDYRAILAALYARGYYSGAISILIDGQEAATRSLTDPLPETAQVLIRIDPGPSFAFGQAQILNAPDIRHDEVPTEARDLFRPGLRARAEVVNAAGDEAVEDWRYSGHPLARVADRTVIANHPERILDVQINVDPGPAARFGPTEVSGAERVNPQFIRFMADLGEGRGYDPARVEKGRQRLSRLDVFRAVRIIEDETVAADGSLPVTVEVVPRRPRRFGVGATFSSIEGLGLEGYWLHRNLFGRAERLRFDVSVAGIGERGAIEDLDFAFKTAFTKPGIINPDTNLELSLSAEQNEFETYRERIASATGGLTHRFSDRLNVSGYVDLEFSEVEDASGTRTFLTASLPLAATYDNRVNTLDPTGGIFATAQLTPFYEFEFGSAGIRSVTEARTYLSFNEDRTILAFRGQLGTVIGGTLGEIPPNLLFFTGGGGSVRGYPFRSNGLEVDGEIVGARSKLELSSELRQKITDTIGVVGFADGGLVSDAVIPSGTTDLRVGVGGGLRYYSPLGPIRLDVAVPLDRRDGDPSFGFYIGIGQAF